MSILIDSNVLLRMTEESHPHSLIARAAIFKLEMRREYLLIVPQNIYEFWVAATRPLKNNGLDLPPEDVHKTIHAIRQFVEFRPDNEAIYNLWLDLVLRYQCKGKPAHDARLVAAMLAHGIGTILTFNKQDFMRFREIKAISPDEVH